MVPSEKQELLAKAVQGDLEQAESKALLDACREEPELIKTLADLLSVDRQLAQALESDPDQFARELHRRMTSEADTAEGNAFVDRVVHHVQCRHRNRVLLACAAGLVFVLSIVALIVPDRANEPQAITVARVARAEASTWQTPKTGLLVGTRVVFNEGLIALRYDKGVEVVLEGPADFEITSDSSGYLHRGKLVAEITGESATGFVIDGLHGRLVDLGTKFGVSVSNAGEMEVHVLEGVVNATSTADGSTTQLRENEAMRMGAENAARLPKANGAAFVTQLPPHDQRAPRYVRWSFEEPRGARFADSGRDLANPETHAEIKGAVERITGYYGNAVSFDGKAAYLESEFRGIVGAGPRTVAFWVRVPEDFGEREGFGVVNWGTHEREGAAWQISINSHLPEGPIGRLRIGTNGGEVIGTTDLRDGQWHHCAVVMYGDLLATPNTSTHILLYVDGQLEPAALKSIRAINTSTTIDHGVWMGRNLGFSTDGGSSGGEYGQFFRGDLDEVIICDTALNQVQIRRLMTENEMP